MLVDLCTPSIRIPAIVTGGGGYVLHIGILGRVVVLQSSTIGGMGGGSVLMKVEGARGADPGHVNHRLLGHTRM